MGETPYRFPSIFHIKKKLYSSIFMLNLCPRYSLSLLLANVIPDRTQNPSLRKQCRTLLQSWFSGGCNPTNDDMKWCRSWREMGFHALKPNLYSLCWLWKDVLFSSILNRGLIYTALEDDCLFPEGLCVLNQAHKSGRGHAKMSGRTGKQAFPRLGEGQRGDDTQRAHSVDASVGVLLFIGK